MKKKVVMLAALSAMALSSCAFVDNMKNMFGFLGGSKDSQTTDTTNTTSTGTTGSTDTTPVAEMYDVTFHNGSQVYSKVSVEKGKTVAKPTTNPTKADSEFYSYSFDKWTLESGTAYDFATPVTGALDLFASYTETHLKVNVTFVDQGETYLSTTIDKGTKVSAPETNPSKAATEDFRYDFAGWKLGTELYDFDTEVMEDITLVSSYTEVALRYKVTYLVEGTTYLVDYANAGEPATKPADPTKADANGYRYTFTGWTLDGVAYDFATPVTEHITLVASFTESPITYVARVRYNYEGGAEDAMFPYTVLNRAEVLEQLASAVPSEDSIYLYEFTEALPTVLPLESKVYTVDRVNKSFEADFNDNQPNANLAYINRTGEDDPESYVDGVYTVSASNNVLITDKNYQYFDMEFDVKVTGMSQPRFAMLLGVEDSQVDKCYVEVFNSIGADAFMFTGGTSDNVRYFKDGNKIETNYGTVTTPDYANTFVNVKLSVYKDSYSLKINDKLVTGIDTSMTPRMGHIYFSRADYQGQLAFDNFKVTATDGEKPVSTKSFEADFEDGTMPENLVWNPRSGEPAVDVSNGALNCKFTNGNLYTQDKFTNFDLRFSALIGSGRLAVEFGADETNKGYAGASSVEGGATGLLFVLDGGGNPVQVRYFKNNVTSTSYTMIYNAKNADTLALRLNGSQYVNFHVQVIDGNCIVEIGNEQVMSQPLGTAHEGHIVFARGNGDGSLTQANFDNISVYDLDI